MSWSAVREAEHRLLEDEASATAIHWATFLQENLSELHTILRTGLISLDDQRVFDFASAAGGVFRYEVIRSDGVTAFSSWAGDFRKTNTEVDLSAVLKHGKHIVKLFDHNGFTKPTEVVSEAYVPVVIDDRIEGAIRVYVDLTARANILRQTGNYALAALITLLSLIGALFGSFIWNNIRDRNRELKEIIESRERVLSAEQALRESENRHRSLLDQTLVAMTVHNGREILYANEAAADLYGASSADDMLGRDPLELVHPDDRASLTRRHRTVLNNQRTPTVEQRRIRLDGTPIIVECAGSPITWAGEQCILSEIRDITESKQSKKALLAAKEEAEFANRSKNEFLANMSHELRTPLNAIIGFSEIMNHEMLGRLGNPRYHEYCSDIHQSGTHLLYVINDILDLSKIEAGKLELNDETFDPKAVIESSLRLVKDRAKDRNIKLVVSITKKLPRLRADQLKIKQVLINLLSNAVKFTREGGSVKVEMDLSPARELIISVIDTGIGIAPEEIVTALTPFGQVDSTLARKFEGTGLGLPLAKSFVELHGGALDLESEIGSGTTVTVRLPPERLVA